MKITHTIRLKQGSETDSVTYQYDEQEEELLALEGSILPNPEYIQCTINGFAIWIPFCDVNVKFVIKEMHKIASIKSHKDALIRE